LSFPKGYLLVAISAAAFGTLPVFARFAYQAGIDTPTLLFLRFNLAALVMFGWMILRKEPLPRGKNLAILFAARPPKIKKKKVFQVDNRPGKPSI
jgi:hypothetical protein